MTHSSSQDSPQNAGAPKAFTPRSKNPFKATAEIYRQNKENRTPISEAAVEAKLDSVGGRVNNFLSLGNILNISLIAGTLAVSAYGMNLNQADQAVLADQRSTIASLGAQNNRLDTTYQDLSSADNSKATVETILTKARSIADSQMAFITTTELSAMPKIKEQIHDQFLDSSYHLESTLKPDGPYFLSGIGKEPALHIDVAQPVYESNGTWSVILTLKDEASDIYGWATLTYSPIDQKFTGVTSQLAGYGQKVIDDMHQKAVEKGFGSHYEGIEGLNIPSTEPSESPSAESTEDPHDESSTEVTEEPTDAEATNESSEETAEGSGA